MCVPAEEDEEAEEAADEKSKVPPQEDPTSAVVICGETAHERQSKLAKTVKAIYKKVKASEDSQRHI